LTKIIFGRLSARACILPSLSRDQQKVGRKSLSAFSAPWATFLVVSRRAKCFQRILDIRLQFE